MSATGTPIHGKGPIEMTRYQGVEDMVLTA